MNKLKINSGNFTINNANETPDRLIVEGYAAMYGTTNLNGWIVDNNSFAEFMKRRENGTVRTILNYEHNNDQQIGRVVELITDDKGLFATAELNLEIPFVNDWLRPNILAGDLKSFSTEGYPMNGRNDIVKSGEGYYIKNFLLSALAITKHPAEPQANFNIANYLKEIKWQEPKKFHFFY